MPLFKSNPKPARKPKGKPPWVITFSGRLLGLQSIGFLVLAIATAPQAPIVGREFDELWLAGLYITLAFLSAVSALGILRLRPLAWNLAMLLEGVTLLQALSLYWRERPFYIYIQMFFGIIVVINFNQPELRRSFETEIIEEHTEIHEERES